MVCGLLKQLPSPRLFELECVCVCMFKASTTLLRINVLLDKNQQCIDDDSINNNNHNGLYSIKTP